MIVNVMFPYNSSILDCEIDEKISESEYISMLRSGEVNQKFLKNLNKNNNDYTYYSLNGNVYDMNEEEIDIDFLNDISISKSMGILTINIQNTNILDDVNEEVLSWVKESNKILKHPRLNDDNKILSLPEKPLKLIVNGQTMILDGSKIVNVYSLYKWEILFRKIIYIK